MKTERRHDLETNDLAVRMTAWIDKFKPHTSQLIGVVIVLLGLLIANSWWNSYSAARQRAAWDAFSVAYDTSDPELASLRRVADQEEYAGTPMQEWAYITWADRQVLLASSTYLIDRKASLDRLRQVVGVYEGLLAGAVDEQVQQRARFGLARVYEMQDKLDEARRNYSLVQGVLQPMASERAAQLDLPEVQSACNWLATAELPKRDLTGVGRTPGERPEFDAELPPATPGTEPLGADLPDTRSLEEILGIVGEEEADDEDRYAPGEGAQNTSESESAAEQSADASGSQAETTSGTEDSADEEAAPESGAAKQ